MHAAPAAHSDRTIPVGCTRCGRVTFFAPYELDAVGWHVCQACCDAEDRRKAAATRGAR